MNFQTELQQIPKYFNINDLDQQLLKESVEREARAIFNGPYSNNNRSLQKIVNDTYVGHAAEEFLIQKLNYKTNPLEFNDVISPAGEWVEVKVVNYKWCNEYRIEQDPKHMNLKLWAEKYKNPNHDSQSRYVLVFSTDNINYEFFGAYDLETSTKV